jgi:hypothetical protein
MSHVCLTCTENLNRVVRSGDGMHTAFRKAHEMKGINDEATLQALAAHDRAAVEQAARLFRLVENTGINYSSVFTPLLGRHDEAARGILRRRLRPAMPSNTPDRERWLGPNLSRVEAGTQTRYRKMAQNLKGTLVFNRGIMPLGLLRSCINYALNR